MPALGHISKMVTPLRTERGFTLIEMMVVLIIIGILAAIVIPNLMRMQTRAEGNYPDNPASATPEGLTLRDLCLLGAYPDNPFTDAPTMVSWDADPGTAGEIGINPAGNSSYRIRAHGRYAMLSLELSSGI